MRLFVWKTFVLVLLLVVSLNSIAPHATDNTQGLQKVYSATMDILPSSEKGPQSTTATKKCSATSTKAEGKASDKSYFHGNSRYTTVPTYYLQDSAQPMTAHNYESSTAQNEGTRVPLDQTHRKLKASSELYSTKPEENVTHSAHTKLQSTKLEEIVTDSAYKEYSLTKRDENKQDQSTKGTFAFHPQNCSHLKPTLHMSEGRITFASYRCMLTAVTLMCPLTVIVPEGRYITVQFDSFSFDYPCRTGGIEMYDGPDTDSRLLAWICGDHTVYKEPPRHTTSNIMHMQVLLKEYYHHPAFNITFVSTTEPMYPRLTANYTSENAGYLRSPGFDGIHNYENDLDSKFEFTVPDGQVLVLSSPVFNVEIGNWGGCIFDFLRIYSTESGEIRLLHTFCGRYFPIQIFNVSILLHFHTDYATGRIGFYISFSFHPSATVPTQIESGLLNCSLATYSAVRDHVECNYIMECQAGQDEEQCPWSTGSCLTILGRSSCYRYISGSEGITWNRAAQVCRENGSYLAAPKTVQHAEALEKIVMAGKRTRDLYLGLRTADNDIPFFYGPGRQLQWDDGTMSYDTTVPQTMKRSQNASVCVKLLAAKDYFGTFLFIECGVSEEVCDFVCQSTLPASEGKNTLVRSIELYTDSDMWNDPCYNYLIKMARCMDGHVVHDFLACGIPDADCTVATNTTPNCGDSVFKSFECHKSISYTLVCDFRPDCEDGSDETFCVHTDCSPNYRPCQNGQCILENEWCDGRQNCVDMSDEGLHNCQYPDVQNARRISKPAVVNFNGFGDFTQQKLDDFSQCPETHFLCPDSYCLPVYLRCNQIYDCPGWEDETDCHTATCPGFYRCRDSSVCLHADHVCDGVFQCPRQDDELLCGLTCPEGCQCQGLAFVCATPFPVASHRQVRYVDASGSGMTLDDFYNNHYLIYLRLSYCELENVGTLVLPNLLTMDLSSNNIKILSSQDIMQFGNLMYLILSNNPLASVKVQSTGRIHHNNLALLDASHTLLNQISNKTFSVFPRLRFLNISFSATETLLPGSFNATTMLEIIDIRGILADIIPRAEFRDLVHLTAVHAKNFKMCCRDLFSDGFNMKNCNAPDDVISSCTNLIGSGVYRACLWMLVFLVLLTNAANLLLRLCTKEQGAEGSAHVLLNNLSMSDFLIGLYLSIIGVADQMLKGNYMWFDSQWRASAMCKTAGFLFFTSRQVSAFTFCLLTLDQIMTLHVTDDRYKLHRNSARRACVTVWVVVLALAAIPLLPITADWKYYGQSAICTPLPLPASQDFQGKDYFFGVSIILNMSLSLTATVGQFFLLLSAKTKPASQSLACRFQERSSMAAVPLRVMSLAAIFWWVVADCLALMTMKGFHVPEQLNLVLYTLIFSFNAVTDPAISAYAFLKKALEQKENRFCFFCRCWSKK